MKLTRNDIRQKRATAETKAGGRENEGGRKKNESGRRRERRCSKKKRRRSILGCAEIGVGDQMKITITNDDGSASVERTVMLA